MNAVIQFLIVSFVIFWLIKVLTRLHVRQDATCVAASAITERDLARGDP